MKILVTGGAGYIGSHTAGTMERSGHTPVIFDNFSTGHRWAVGSRALVEGDLTDAAAIRRAIDHHRVQAVIHFAAHAEVGESVRNPRKYFHNNVLGTLNLLDAMVDLGVKYLVFSSTCATYGLAEKVPISEDHPQCPANPYGESKLFVERMLGWYEKAYDLRWVALRYFNAAGASQELGECHTPETHLIPLAIQAAITGIPLSILGTDYPTEDGTAVRDYIHVDDLAAAHLLAIDYLVKEGKSRALNLGTGQGYSVRQVVKMVEQVSGIAVPWQAAGRRPGDPPTLIADNVVAADVLGWRPDSSSLHNIVESAWRWHSSAYPKRSSKKAGC